MARVRKGEMKILFVAPERLLNEGKAPHPTMIQFPTHVC